MCQPCVGRHCAASLPSSCFGAASWRNLAISQAPFTELRLCLASTKLVWTHLAYIRYLCCFSPHCNKPKCYAVHLPNRLRNGRYHSGIQSPPPLPWQPPWFLFSSYSSPISKQALYLCLICSYDESREEGKKEAKEIRTCSSSDRTWWE